MLVGIIAAALGGGGSDDTDPIASNTTSPDSHDDSAVQDEAAEAEQEQVAETAPGEPEMTSGQENALRAAENYIAMMPFSKNALIEQLSSSAGDQFTPAQARYAANKVL